MPSWCITATVTELPNKSRYINLKFFPNAYILCFHFLIFSHCMLHCIYSDDLKISPQVKCPKLLLHNGYLILLTF